MRGHRAHGALQARVHLAFDELGLHRVTAGIVPGNAASIGVAERLGMRREAHQVESARDSRGEWVDLLIFALLEREWRDQPHRPGERGCGTR